MRKEDLLPGQNDQAIGGSVIQRSFVPAGLTATINVATVPMAEVCRDPLAGVENLRDLTAEILGLPAEVILDDAEYARLAKAVITDDFMFRTARYDWLMVWERQYEGLRNLWSERARAEAPPLRLFAQDSLALMFGAAPFGPWSFPFWGAQLAEAVRDGELGRTSEAVSTGLACLVAGASPEPRVRDVVSALWEHDIPMGHSPRATSDSLLQMINNGKRMCLAPVAAGGLLGVAQLGQGTITPILTVATGGAMTLILISTLAVGDLIVRHLSKRRPRSNR